ncbi:polysaccharide pyruvyl transferase family protein [Flavobacterium caseinilyticum]|uniref:Polysaccharide pyruvyl transferase family protein n=1 Tax=Flavobacterium caseinilyticum TaxID=2541732 RepID=A0A4R5AXZ7_9FLAO|nr:polysaccharide pyruvyl transferase family protein [Flavobacterium caseinilyticum]TDD77020.1 polysaccharide pyruvyl transferase family protein [Flavobacterium caseinilyticum]
MKKIAILTQPLHTNYGGILQAYALQRILKELGHDVLTIDRVLPKLSYKVKVLSVLKRLIMKMLGRYKGPIRIWPTVTEYSTIARKTQHFIDKYISLTERIENNKELVHLKKYNFDVYVVGSDQAWRPQYSPNILNYFLDFVENEKRIKRLSYAVSFGVDEWEFNSEQTKQAAELIKLFDGVSVRELSGVLLCEKYLNVKAEFVLDPTLLLNQKDYIELVRESSSVNDVDNGGKLFAYVLDRSVEKQNLISKIAKQFNSTAFEVMPENNFQEVGSRRVDDCVYPPITDWIKGFMDADYIVTDSFHGTVFSIIFNKPFITIGNKGRGLSRFQSLLSLFNLENRLVIDCNNVPVSLLEEQIDFNKVNEILNIQKAKSIQYLINALNK